MEQEGNFLEIQLKSELSSTTEIDGVNSLVFSGFKISSTAIFVVVNLLTVQDVGKRQLDFCFVFE